MSTWIDEPSSVRPMLASTREVPLESPDFLYEPKYDGIRALASVDARGVRLWSRAGNDKTAQFPEIAKALTLPFTRSRHPMLLDGEVVALDAHGNPSSFQNLQRRATAASAIAFVVFDMLRDGDEDLRPLGLRDRRARLEQRLEGATGPVVRISEQVQGTGRALWDRAERDGWEGLVAKRADAPYKSGSRSPDWIKVKLVHHQTSVVAGWTEPRGTRPFFGALLLGVYDEARQLQYIGHTGAGFSDAELGRVWNLLQRLRTRESPFTPGPKTNAPAHWVKPRLVVEVKFTEWTVDGKLRHPTYLGVRDDVKPDSVRREPMVTTVNATSRVAPVRRARGRSAADAAPPPVKGHRSAASRSTAAAPTTIPAQAIARLLERIDELEERGGKGLLDLPGGETLEVSNLDKVFWPEEKLTKGDLLRHDVRVAACLLPVIADRPLVMKRFPKGITGKPFYQHRAPERVPSGVRAETVVPGDEVRSHLIGGTLTTLLYTAQLGAISQDPWFSRVGSVDVIDHVALDLDPPDDLPFARVLDVARWVQDVLGRFDATGFPKTSGADGLHVYVPMPKGTPYDSGLLFAQIVATIVAGEHPRAATIERSLAARGQRIYVDYLQNIKGKTLASAYSARASVFAGVSTPLTWDEVERGVSPRDFTVANFAHRLEQVGDVWAAFRRAKGVRLPTRG